MLFFFSVLFRRRYPLYWIGWLGDLSPTPNAPMCFFFNRKMLIFFVIIFRVESDDDDSETFVNSSGSLDQSEAAAFYLGDKHIPVYASEMKKLSNSNIARLSLDPPEDKVASKPPVKCKENKIFIIDKKSPCFRNPDDWKADGLGVSKNEGTHVVAYYEDKNPEIRWISKTKPEDCKRFTVFLKRTYWTHGIR